MRCYSCFNSATAASIREMSRDCVKDKSFIRSFVHYINPTARTRQVATLSITLINLRKISPSSLFYALFPLSIPSLSLYRSDLSLFLLSISCLFHRRSDITLLTLNFVPIPISESYRPFHTQSQPYSIIFPASTIFRSLRDITLSTLNLIPIPLSE